MGMPRSTALVAKSPAQVTPALWRDLLALTKPRLTALVLFTTAGGLYLAPGERRLFPSLVAVLATAMVVGAANALNCYLERDSDRLMARTRRRPLPAGRLDAEIALCFGLLLAAFSIPALALAVNPLSGFLGLVAFVSYVWVYTPLKRITPLAMHVGAVPGAIPPLLGWASATGRIELGGIILFSILFFWQLPHFLAIAIYRKEDYSRAGIKVMPAVIGDRATKLRMPIYSAALLLCSLALVPLGVAGYLYFALALVAGLAFFASTLLGLLPTAGAAWARKVFLGSLLYITLIFLALALDAR